MIIVQLQGGLGNQMFQYALGRVLSLKNNTTLGLDAHLFGRNNAFATRRDFALGSFTIQGISIAQNELPYMYRIPFPVVDKIVRFIIVRILKVKGVEKKPTFDSTVLGSDKKENLYLQGYWQSYKYFLGYEDIIRSDFQLKKKPAGQLSLFCEEISSKQSLCIHVRRGDFVGNPVHDVVGADYYAQSFEYLNKKITPDIVYIFSEDIAWCKQHLLIKDVPVVFVTKNYLGMSDQEQLHCMSLCKYFIIANSTFSWWAAWLAEYKEKIVIAPMQWFGDTIIDTSDLIPPSWIRL